MASINIGHDIQVAAEDVLKAFTWFGKKVEVAEKVEPQVVAALAVLLTALTQAAATTAAATQAHVNITLDLAAYNAILAVWPDILAFVKTLGITLPAIAAAPKA